MPVISFASTKGGVGKTTLAFCVATTLERRLPPSPEYPVAGIDADPNGSLTDLLSRAASPRILSLAAETDTLLATIREAQAKAAVVLVDLEGSANQAMLYAFAKSDLVVIPAQPSALDVTEAARTAKVVSQAAEMIGREIAQRVVLTRTPVLRQRVAEHAREQFVRGGLPLLPVELVQRAAFQSMTYTGQTPLITEPDGPAAANIEAITDAICEAAGVEWRKAAVA